MLIAMCTWDTHENKRAPITGKCLKSLYETVNFQHHRFVFVDNGSSDPESLEHSEEWVRKINEKWPGRAERVLLPENRGTAIAINVGWAKRLPGEGCCKVDSDIVWEETNWADRMEEAVNRHRRGHHRQKALHQAEPHNFPPPPPLIGCLGLKRNDCSESMYRTDWGGTKLYEVDHEPGERWIVIERANHIMGSCVYVSPEAMDKVGYLYQGFGRWYGYDDSLYCDRLQVAGMMTCFLLGFTLHHIDPGDTPYQKWKEDHSGGEAMRWRLEMRNKYISGKVPVYYDMNGQNPPSRA